MFFYNLAFIFFFGGGGGGGGGLGFHKYSQDAIRLGT